MVKGRSDRHLNPNSEIGEPAWPRMWLDVPGVQPLCARTLSNYSELLRAFAIFREGAENSTRGACAPQATSESGLKSHGLPAWQPGCRGFIDFAGKYPGLERFQQCCQRSRGCQTYATREALIRRSQRRGLRVMSTTSFSRRSTNCSNFPSRPMFTARTATGAPLFLALISATCAGVSCAGAPRSR